MVKTKQGGTRGATGYADTYKGRDKAVVKGNAGHEAIVEHIELVGNWENPNDEKLKKIKDSCDKAKDFTDYREAWKKAVMKSARDMISQVDEVLLCDLQSIAKQTAIDRAKASLINSGIPEAEIEKFLQAQFGTEAEATEDTIEAE